jgi:flavodoxin
MNTLVVFDSEFHNTEAIARSIADATGATIVHARDAAGALRSKDVLFVGAPTQGGRPTREAQAFLHELPSNALAGVHVAAFDTRFDYSTQNFGLKALMKVIGYAAPRIGKALTAKGGRQAAPPEGFIVEGKEGPLREGELTRAADWARRAVAIAAASNVTA